MNGVEDCFVATGGTLGRFWVFFFLSAPLPGGTAATAPKRMSPLSLSAASVDSTAATTLPGPFLEFLTCQHVLVFSASSLASSHSIFFATWSRRLPGSLRRNRSLKRRPGGSPGGRHAIGVLMSCVGACPPSCGWNTILLSCSWTFGENCRISSAFSASYGLGKASAVCRMSRSWVRALSRRAGST